jgi:hypothetical protein
MNLRWSNVLLGATMAIPVVAFFLFLVAHTVNVPYMDDAAMMETMNYLSFKTLFAQQNVHRITFARLGALLVFWLNGSLHFQYQALVGYGSLLLLGGAFFLIFKSLSARLAAFLPVVFLLFSPVVYVVHVWSITAFQYTLSIAFSLLALYFVRPLLRRGWYWAAALSVCATLSNLDGLSVIPLCVFWLLNQKRFKEAGYYTLFAGIYLTVFFYDFSLGQPTQSPPSIGLILLSFVCLVGSFVKAITDSNTLTMSCLLGGAMLLVFAVGLLKKWQVSPQKGQWLPVLTLTEISFLKMLACMAMIAVGRASGGNIAPRFLAYSVAMFAVFYLLLLQNTHSKSPIRTWLIGFFVVFSVSINVVSYKKYAIEAQEHRDALMADAYNFTTHGVFLHQYFNLPDPEPSFYKYYRFPTYLANNAIKDWRNKLTIAQMQDQSLNTVVKKEDLSTPFMPLLQDFYNVEIGNIDYRTIAPNAKIVYLALLSQETGKVYLASLRPNSVSWLKQLTGQAKFTTVGSSFAAKLTPGRYTIGMCWSEKDQNQVRLVQRDVMF